MVNQSEAFPSIVEGLGTNSSRPPDLSTSTEDHHIGDTNVVQDENQNRDNNNVARDEAADDYEAADDDDGDDETDEDENHESTQDGNTQDVNDTESVPIHGNSVQNMNFRLSELTETVINDFSLGSKLVPITRDNASANNSMITHSNWSRDRDGQPIICSVICFHHVVHLSVKDLLDGKGSSSSSY